MKNTEIRICEFHGETEFVYTDKRWRCKKCWVEWDKNKRHKIKQKLVDYKGGKCSVCGYDKCLNALEFHHVDKTTKLFALNSGNFGKAYKTLVTEADKCILLCANCHREIHYDENELRRKDYIEKHAGYTKARVIDKLDYDKIYSDFKNGMFQQEIAEKYNVSLASVKRFMQKHNISRKHLKLSSEELLKLFEENPTYTYVSKKLGHSTSAIKKYCIKNNLINQINEIRQKHNLPKLSNRNIT